MILKNIAAAASAAAVLFGAALAAESLSIGGASAEIKGDPVARYSFQNAWPSKTGAVKEESQTLTLTLKAGALSRQLREAQRSGKPIPSMRLSAEIDGEPVMWELKDVKITSYSVSGSGASAMETVTIVCEHIQRVSV